MGGRGREEIFLPGGDGGKGRGIFLYLGVGGGSWWKEGAG